MNECEKCRGQSGGSICSKRKNGKVSKREQSRYIILCPYDPNPISLCHSIPPFRISNDRILRSAKRQRNTDSHPGGRRVVQLSMISLFAQKRRDSARDAERHACSRIAWEKSGKGEGYAHDECTYKCTFRREDCTSRSCGARSTERRLDTMRKREFSRRSTKRRGAAFSRSLPLRILARSSSFVSSVFGAKTPLLVPFFRACFVRASLSRCHRAPRSLLSSSSSFSFRLSFFFFPFFFFAPSRFQSIAAWDPERARGSVSSKEERGEGGRKEQQPRLFRIESLIVDSVIRGGSK